MQQMTELLRDADPLRHEPGLSTRQRDELLYAILGGVPEAPGRKPTRRRAVLAASAAVTVAVAVLFRPRLQAAMRFEVRLAEDKPSHGLDEVRVGGSGRSIYLHKEDVVTNSDIRAAKVIEGDSRLQYWISIEFSTEGARKMRAATRNHIGRPIAILLNGQVTAAPVVRTSVDSAARITGNFTKEEAQKIVDGLSIR